jgi:hypothetical protein
MPGPSADLPKSEHGNAKSEPGNAKSEGGYDECVRKNHDSLSVRCDGAPGSPVRMPDNPCD